MVVFYILTLVLTFLGVVINLPGTIHFNPILLNIFDAKTTLLLTTSVMAMSSVCRIIVFRNKIALNKDLIYLSAFGILGGFIGGSFINIIPEKVIIMIFIFSGLRFLYVYLNKRKESGENLPKKEGNLLYKDLFFSGFLASFMQSFGISVGSIRQGYYFSRGYLLQEVHGTVAIVFLSSATSLLISRFIFEKYDANILLKILPLFPFMLLITYIGKITLYKLSRSLQDKIIIYSLILSLLSVLPKLVN